MAVTFRNPKVGQLARQLAQQEGTDMTQAVISALERSVKKPDGKKSLKELAYELADRLRRETPGGGRLPTKEERDEMWGH